LGISELSTLDPVGQTLRTTRIGSNSWQIVTGQWSYDVAGRMTAQTNALNGCTTYARSTNNYGATVETTTYPDGGIRVVTNYLDGSTASITGTAAHPVRYLYAALYGGETTQEIKLNEDGSDSSEWVFSSSDMLGRRVSRQTPSGTSGSFYNTKGQLWKTVDADSVVMLYQYDKLGKVEYSAVDVNRNDTIDFAGMDRVTRSLSGVSLGTVNPAEYVRKQTTHVWNADNSSVSIATATNETSLDGLQAWSFSPAGTSRTIIAYAGNGCRYSTNILVDGSFRCVQYLYGRQVAVISCDAGGQQLSKTTYSYDAHGRQATTTDARGGTTTFAFNSADQIVTVTSPSPGLGQPVQTTSTEYNSSPRSWRVTSPDGAVKVTEYYPNGLVQKQYGARTYPVEYTYDYAGRMKTMKTWRDFSSATGAAITTWNYDADGRLSSKYYPDETTGNSGTTGTTYYYTPGGRLQWRYWARGFYTYYEYSAAGDLESVAYSDGVTPDLAYGYDRLGRQSSVTRTLSGVMSTLLRQFNQAGQVLSETWSGGSLDGLIVTNQFDQYLRRTNLALMNGGAVLSSTAYGYDSASRMRTVSQPSTFNFQPVSATYSYLANAPLVSQIAFANNGVSRMTTARTYDLANRLEKVSSAITGGSGVSFHYGYNAANQRTTRREADGSYWRYEYDSLGQVISGKKFWSDGSLVPGQQFDYAFDDIGNRTATKAGGDANGAHLRVGDYSANLLNQYSSRTVPGAVDVMGVSFATNTVLVNGQGAWRKGEYFRKELAVDNATEPIWTNITVTAAGQISVSGYAALPPAAEEFSYDYDGNLTQDGLWAYAWDSENRLIAMESSSSLPEDARRKVEFQYDHQGRRIEKVVSTWSGSWVPQYTNRFVYDGWNLIATLNPQLSMLNTFAWGLDLSGSLQGAGGVGGLLWVNDPSTINSQPSTHFVSYDGNGNVVALFNAANGSESARYEYGPFGEVIRATGPMAKANPFRFSTKYQDDESDLLYYGYRYYNASTGRWLSRDPIQERGGIDLYEYVRNNPIANIDALGKICIDPCGLAKALGKGGTNWREQGGVVCCGGKKYACVWNTTPFVGKAKDIVWSCVYDHESSHFNDIPDCPICDLWPTRLNFKIPVDKSRAECAAWKGSIGCYQKALDTGACGGDPLCEGLITVARDEAERQKDHFCSGGN
jgi:RHS repeat-associated protein